MPGFESAQYNVGRVFFVKVLDGSNPHRAIEEFLDANGIEFASIQGIGGFEWVRIGVFSPEERKYYTIDVEPEPGRVLECISILGNSIRGPDGAYYTHLHVTVAKKPDSVFAGHLVDARVRPFLELVIVELQGRVDEARRMLQHRWKPSG